MLTVGINTAPLAAARTGVGRYIAGLVEGLSGLRAQGVSVKPLFVPTAPSRGLRRFVKLLPGAYALAEAARGATLSRERRSGLSVYHETNHAAPPFDGPVVLTVHDLSTLLHPATQEPQRARHFAQALLARARSARRVIVPTEAIAAEVARHLGVERGRLRAIHHGVDARFTPGAREREGFVLFVGAAGPRKGVETLRAALPAGRELVVAGPPERYVDEGELLDLYRRAAVLVLPSLYEGFGFPLVEAFACGTPAIASDDPALVEVSGGAALHFPRGDANALRALLSRVLDEPGLRAELSQRGLSRAESFRWAKCAALHLEAYREAAQ